MKIRILVAPALSILLCVASAYAQTLDVTLIDPNQTVTQGTTSIAFDATIFNPSTTATIYLNGDAAATSSPFLTVNDTPFFNDAPLSLAPGQSSGMIELFDVDLAAATPTGTYALNTFSILGGADGGTLSLFNDLADVQFSVTVNSAASVSAPEIDPSSAPSAIALLVGWLAVLLGRAGRSKADGNLKRPVPSKAAHYTLRVTGLLEPGQADPVHLPLPLTESLLKVTAGSTAPGAPAPPARVSECRWASRGFVSAPA